MAWEITDTIRGRQGDPGAKGDKGDAGTPATIIAAGASTVAPDQPASVTVGGSPTARTFTFGIPKGQKGDQGPAGTIASASAESVPAGQNAEVIMSGTSEVKHAHFRMPRGLPGVLAIENDEAVATYLGAVDSKLTAAFYARLQQGGVGIQKADPQNALIYIGSGTGTLPDNQVMGIKVRLDTPAGSRRDGIQANVKVTPDAGAGSVRSMLARVDLADSAGLAGDTVALWGDAWITAASSRNAWGANIYLSIRDDVDYKGNGHALEVGFENRGVRDNPGGGLLVVGKSITSKAAFGIKISNDPQYGSPSTFRTNLLMPTLNKPYENYIWIGNAVNNTPSGAPVFQVNADGKLGMNAVARTEDILTIGGSMRFGETSASARLIAGVGSPEGVVVANRGSIYVDVSGAAATTLWVKTTGTNTSNTGWTAK